MTVRSALQADVELVGYRRDYDRVADYTSPDIARWTPPPREWRLPVMTSNLRADWAKAHEAH